MKAKWVVLLALGAIASTSQAANLRFLQDSVLTEFGKEDIASFKQFIRESLDTVPDQAIVEWHSPHSALKGKVKPKFSFQANGIQCRRTAFLVAKQKAREQYIFDVCRQDDGWKIMETPAASFTKSDWDSLNVVGMQALNHEISSSPFSWFNPRTKNSAVVVPLAIERTEGRSCRDLAISILDKRGRSSNATYRFCKDTDGEWSREIESY